MTNRTPEQIAADLLAVTMEFGASGIGPTTLLRKASTTHSRFSRIVDALVGAGLLIKVESNGSHVYAITSKGRHYLEINSQYRSMVDSFGLEL